MQVFNANVFDNGKRKSKRGDSLLKALSQFDDDFIEALAQDVLAQQDSPCFLFAIHHDTCLRNGNKRL